MVGLAVLVRRHAHHLVALHFGLERAADAAVGAGGLYHPVRHAVLDDRLVHERGRGAGLHAGAAGDAFGGEEIVRAGLHHRIEGAPVDGERKGALHLVAGAHAAGADDALGGVEGEIGVGTRPSAHRGGWRGRRRWRSEPPAGPRRRAMSSSSQSPLAGQVRQSSGWSEMYSSMTPRRILARASVWVRTDMPSRTGSVQAAGMPRRPRSQRGRAGRNRRPAGCPWRRVSVPGCPRSLPRA